MSDSNFPINISPLISKYSHLTDHNFQFKVFMSRFDGSIKVSTIIKPVEIVNFVVISDLYLNSSGHVSKM
jgi:hypothetical protein